MEINAHILIPQQLIQVLGNLMSPLMCCSSKRGIEQAAVFIYENKSYCEDCIKKLSLSVEDLVGAEVNLDAKELDSAQKRE